jgi:aspartyl-tRNA(Asn)/glutamyl-tRNA(Gln) amidotransferase subunit A
MLHQHSFETLRGLFKSREISPVEVVTSAIAHAEDVNRNLNAFALIDAERALGLARASEKRWRDGEQLSDIDGMPITVKESVAVEGWSCRKGSLVSSPTPARENAVFVKRLFEAGAVLFGKTRAPEFNWKGVTDSPGFGITRNPLDSTLTPGGSSGGCAAAVASGVVRVSIGSDAGGSVRIPAAFTGVFGLKPSFGRVPITPRPSAFYNIAHLGPLSKSVTELIEVLQSISGPSGQDPSSSIVPPLLEKGDREIRSLRIGLLKPGIWENSAEVIKRSVLEVFELLRRNCLSADVVEFDVQSASHAGAFFYRVGCAATVKRIAARKRRLLDPALVRLASQARAFTLRDATRAINDRDRADAELGALFAHVDVLLLPTVPILPFEAGRNTPPGWDNDDWLTWNPYTPAFNLAHVPAISIPYWPKNSPLPIGVQAVAAKGREDVLFTIASWLEMFAAQKRDIDV